jgi:hypothetical protein
MAVRAINARKRKMEKEKVCLSAIDRHLKLKELMAKYAIKETLASKARRTGYFWRNYHAKTIEINQGIDFYVLLPMAKKAINAVFRRYGDLIKDQESFESDCVYRIYELSGHQKIFEPKFLLALCYNVFNSWRNAFRKELKEGISFVSLDAMETNQFDPQSNLNRHSVDKLKDHRSEASWFHSECNPTHFYNKKWVVDRYNRQFARLYQK